MKVYKCDSCGRMIENPHRQKMKEFVIVVGGERGSYFPIEFKGKQKIDLCAECFGALTDIAERKIIRREVEEIKKAVARDIIAIIEPRTNGDLGRDFPELESIKEIYGI